MSNIQGFSNLDFIFLHLLAFAQLRADVMEDHYLPQWGRSWLADHRDILLQKCCKPGTLPVGRSAIAITISIIIVQAQSS